MVVHRHGLGRTFHPIWVERFFISWTPSTIDTIYVTGHPLSLSAFSSWLHYRATASFPTNDLVWLTVSTQLSEQKPSRQSSIAVARRIVFFGCDYRNSVGNYTQLLNTFVLNSINYFPFDDSRTTLIQTLFTLVSKCWTLFLRPPCAPLTIPVALFSFVVF